MELATFIQAALDRIHQANLRVINSLTQEEIAWQPTPEANSMGLILLHAARSEDSFVQVRMRAKPQTWETGKWYEKMHLTAAETASGYTAEQLAAFRAPDVKSIMAYWDAVRVETRDYLKSMDPEDFEKKVTFGRMGEVTIASLFTILIIHAGQHSGEISYIRGLKRGMNK
jgi:hypothetical protein